MSPHSSKPVRVRYAPSPTGYFHVGAARTTIFNWLFAEHAQGTLVVRIEDTDTTRSQKEYEVDILNGIRWLGMDYEGIQPDGSIIGNFGPYRQTERKNLYRVQLEKLLAEKHAYYCFCTKEELEEVRQSMMAQGQAPIYNGKCRSLSPDEVSGRLQLKNDAVIRFKMPTKRMVFEDLVRGSISFDGALIGDFVIAKSLDAPLFMVANAIDDALMEISHVIRGEDHLANTPKQIALLDALGIRHPQYAHIPLILNPDRSKMSKRFAATSVTEYRSLGYLPEAIFNFLALLGWHPTDDQEVLDRDQLIAQFTLERVQKAGAIFTIEKLNWLNNHYLRALPSEQIYALVKEQYLDDYLSRLTLENITLPDQERWIKIIDLVKERMHTLADIVVLADFFIRIPDYDATLLLWKETGVAAVQENLGKVQELLEKLPTDQFKKTELEQTVMPLAEERGRGDVLWPLRVALSGKKASPGPFDIMNILGKEESLLRLDLALTKLNQL